MYDEIIFPFPNFNGATVEVWEWINNFIPHFTGRVITYPVMCKYVFEIIDTTEALKRNMSKCVASSLLVCWFFSTMKHHIIYR